MNSMFSQNVSDLLVFARGEASRLSSTVISPEHILLGVLHDNNGVTAAFLHYCDIDLTLLRETVESSIIAEYHVANDEENEVGLDEKASNILRLAVLEARLQRKQMVDVHHVLLAILHDQAHTIAKDILNKSNVDYEKMQKYIAQKTNSTPKNGIFMSDDDSETPEYDEPSGNDSVSASHENGSADGTPLLIISR